jgi:drug/metabolite transporter (DMT)-like permease
VPFLLGGAVDLTGWALSLVAVRSLPLFAVQAAVSASVGVTVVLAVVFLGLRVGRAELAALAVTAVGLLLLGLSSAEGSGHGGSATRIAVVVALLPVVALAAAAGRGGNGDRAATVLGAVAGLSFGGCAIAARVLEVPDHLLALGRSPVAWSVVVYGGLGILLLGTALQRGSVTRVTAALFSVETLVPALVGIALLGDRPRSGLAVVAVVGFAAAFGGAIALTRVETAVSPA